MIFYVIILWPINYDVTDFLKYLCKMVYVIRLSEYLLHISTTIDFRIDR